jgi:hypothetical protein
MLIQFMGGYTMMRTILPMFWRSTGPTGPDRTPIPVLPSWNFGRHQRVHICTTSPTQHTFTLKMEIAGTSEMLVHYTQNSVTTQDQN